MNDLLLHTESQEFINDNLDSDIAKLLLKGVTLNGIDPKKLIEQIESKKKCEKKLPTWYHTKNIYYPKKLNIEQTSSEITARYKASLTKGATIVDLTGGFGVDSYYFSKQFNFVTHCEINEELSKITDHNLKQLQIQNIKMIHEDGLEFLESSNTHYDWIYVDPSRRHDSKGKVFFLKDCSPNVPKELEFLFNHSDNIMIKTSPLLDISVGMKELNCVKAIHVVAVNNEVKELLWILEKRYTSEITIETINIKSTDNEVFTFVLSDEHRQEAGYALPLTYLYEPNSAILKAGAFNSVAIQNNMFKLHRHSHLYTSAEMKNFPGRGFLVETILPYNKKAMKLKNIQKANVTTRNFPETVQQIRKKFNLKDGGYIYLYFTINCNNEKIVIICKKIN